MVSGERYIHPLRRFATRPACLRGTVCWRSEKVSFSFSHLFTSVHQAKASSFVVVLPMWPLSR